QRNYQPSPYVSYPIKFYNVDPHTVSVPPQYRADTGVLQVPSPPQMGRVKTPALYPLFLPDVLYQSQSPVDWPHQWSHLPSIRPAQSAPETSPHQKDVAHRAYIKRGNVDSNRNSLLVNKSISDGVYPNWGNRIYPPTPAL